MLASGWTAEIDDLIGLIHPSLMLGDVLQRAELGDLTKVVTAYHDGDLTAIDTVPVKQVSGPFLGLAWDALRTVKAGEPVTYSEYAVVAGRPGAIRAAANACARNAAALFVPCHRVLRTDGTLAASGGPADQAVAPRPRS